MKISYDAEVDALSIVFLDSTATTVHLAESLTADYDGEGHLVGFEVLDAQKRFGGHETLQNVVVEGLTSPDATWTLRGSPSKRES